MSLQTRQLVANALIYQNPALQKFQLTAKNEHGGYIVHTNMIQLLHDILFVFKAPFLVTAIKTDHHDDSCLGAHSHFAGKCIDGWFLSGLGPTDYMMPDDASFAIWLKQIAHHPLTYSIGLGGSAYTPPLRLACAPIGFEDSGEDHIHLAVV